MQATTPRGFSADTEILTRRGWLGFDQVTYLDEVATRSPEGRFLWQRPERLTWERYDGDMIRFANRRGGTDLLVTPNQRILHTSGHGGARCSELVKRADECQQLRSGAMIATSCWDQPDLDAWNTPACIDHGYVEIDAGRLRATREELGWGLGRLAREIGATKQGVVTLERTGRCHAASLPRIRAACVTMNLPVAEIIRPHSLAAIAGDDFAAFMGAYLSEGCVSEARRGYFRIFISQCRKSKGFEPYQALLTRMLGREPYYDGRSWSLNHEGFGAYLQQCGHSAPEKRIPREILDLLSARQLRIFLDFYRLGDGWMTGNSEAFTTTSGVLAGQLQEVAQKIGFSASVRRREVAPRGSIRGRLIKSACPRYDIFLRTTKRPKWTSAERVRYDGYVCRATVPDCTVYVRRNGYAIWSG